MSPGEATPIPSDPLALQTNGNAPLNVVLVLVDDQRWDGFGFMGHGFLKTPGLDALAKEGAWCASSFVTTSLCCPSRASMLTGLYAHAHGVLNNQTELDPRIPTYAQYAQAAGYDTAYIGKWHMGALNPHPRPGWKRWIGFRGQGRYRYPPDDPALPPADRGFSFDGTLREVSGYVTDVLTDLAVEYLEGRADNADPFCMVVGHKACHAPFEPAQRHRGAFPDAPAPPVLPDTDEAYEGLPTWLRRLRHDTIFGVENLYGNGWPDFASWYRDYHRTLLAVDEGVSRILSTLAATGLAERTLVLYTSDNGFMHGEKGVLDKRNFYEPSIRTPFLARLPGASPRRIEEMVLNNDVAPTILDAMGLRPPKGLHGRSVLPLLRGQSPAGWRTDFLYEYFHERVFPTTPTVVGLRTATHKLVTHRGVDEKDNLFDLQADPEEVVDLMRNPDHAETRRAMFQRLRERMAQTGLMIDPVWGRSWLDPARARPKRAKAKAKG